MRNTMWNRKACYTRRLIIDEGSLIRTCMDAKRVQDSIQFYCVSNCDFILEKGGTPYGDSHSYRPGCRSKSTA